MLFFNTLDAVLVEKQGRERKEGGNREKKGEGREKEGKLEGKRLLSISKYEKLLETL